MKPSIVGRLSIRTLLLAAGVVALMVGIACGGAEEPAPAAQQQQAPAAQQQQQQAAPAATDAPAAMQPTNTPIPQAADATARPTNTPAPTATPRVVATPTPSAGPKYGGLLRMSAYADTKDWDPLGSSSLSSVISYSQLYNQIVQYDTVDTNAITGDLAESWDVSPDGLTYTFHLRENMQWTDGTEITSADIISTHSRYANPCNSTGRSGLWRNYAVKMEVVDKDGGNCAATNQDAVLRAVDDKTVEFNLQFASGAFIKFLAIDYAKVLPGHKLDADANCAVRDAANPCSINLGENILAEQGGVTSGPFVLDEYQVGDFYYVDKNENYFKEGRPYVDRIEHTIFTGQAKDTLIANFEAGRLDMANGGFTNLSPTQYFDLEKSTNSEYVAHPIAAGTNWGLMLNVKKPQFQSHLVRQAINLAVDRQEIDERVFDNSGGSYCPLMGLAHANEVCMDWPGIRAKDTPGGQEDLATAKALMVEAGHGDGLEVQYTVRQVGNYPDQCQVVKQQLQDALGITGDIETLPSAAGYAKYGTSRAEGSAGDWEISCQGEGMVVFDPDAVYGGVYLKGGTRNYTDWSNDMVVDWFERQKVELDPEARREINKEAELFLHSFEDNHWVTLQLGQLFWLVHRDVKGFTAPSTVQYQFKHEDLWLDR
ncbi:MAG: ABC transporter substrate-binding protein [Chloroflexi bacterium]|nr:ABC transporter substrate-binding protein [Chloroflexota bacterium]